MASYAHHQAPSAPPMYPEVVDNIHPVPPVRSEFSRHPQEESLLPPRVPVRMDKPSSSAFTDTTPRRVNIEIMLLVFLKMLLHNYCHISDPYFYLTKSAVAYYFFLRMVMRKILLIQT